MTNYVELNHIHGVRKLLIRSVRTQNILISFQDNSPAIKKSIAITIVRLRGLRTPRFEKSRQIRTPELAVCRPDCGLNNPQQQSPKVCSANYRYGCYGTPNSSGYIPGRISSNRHTVKCWEQCGGGYVILTTHYLTYRQFL